MLEKHAHFPSRGGKAGAIEFLKFLATPEQSAAWTLTSGYLAMSGHAVVPDLEAHPGVLDEIRGEMSRLGIGHGTFYRYFENKRDIVEHVITDLIERIVETLGAENAPEAAHTLEDYRAQTERIGTALAGIFSEDPRVPLLLLSAAGGYALLSPSRAPAPISSCRAIRSRASRLAAVSS